MTSSARVGDRVDAGVGRQEVEALAGDDVEGGHTVGGHTGDRGEDAGGDEACAQPGEGGGAGAHEDAINAGVGELRGQAYCRERLAHKRGDGFGVVASRIVLGAAENAAVVDDGDGGGCLGV